MMYFLDTNIIIYAMNGKFPEISRHFEKIPSTSICIPSVVIAEIEYGARKSNDYIKTMDIYRPFLNVFTEAPFSDKAVGEYGLIRSELEKKGTPIGGNDLLIAATVRALNGTLVTHNIKEFSRIDGLLIEDWTI